MSETFLYTSLLETMAAPFNGQIVPAAHGAQVRENLMAIFTGETFKVSNTLAQTTSGLYVYNTVNWATPNVRVAPSGQGFPAYTGGAIGICAGVWMIGFNCDQTTVGAVSLLAVDGQGRCPGTTDCFARDNSNNLFSVYAAGSLGSIVAASSDVVPNTSVADCLTELWGYQISDL